MRVRTLFLELLRLAVRLPWIMEEEHKAVTGRKRSYKDFWTTTGAAKCCKALRNANEHALTIRLATDERFRAQLTDLVGPMAPAGRALTVVAEASGLDPFGEELSPGVRLYRADPTSGEIDLHRPVRTGRETRFVVDPTTEGIREALAAAGTRDIHVLSEMCYGALRRLVEGHRAALAAQDQAGG